MASEASELITFVTTDGNQRYTTKLFPSQQIINIQIELSYKLGYPIYIIVENEIVQSWKKCEELLKSDVIYIKKIGDFDNIWHSIALFGNDVSPLLSNAVSLCACLLNPKHKTLTKVDLLTLDDEDGCVIEVSHMNNKNKSLITRLNSDNLKMLTGVSGTLYQVPDYVLSLTLITNGILSKQLLMKQLKFIECTCKKTNLNVHFIIKDTDGCVLFETKDCRCDKMVI